MGKRIVIEDADYSFNNLNGGQVVINFDLLSNNAASINFNVSAKTLSLLNGGGIDDYNFAASSNVNKVKITMPISSPIGLNAFVIGTNTNGDGLVFYLDYPGQAGKVFIFPKTGIVTSLVSVYTASNTPNLSKGNPVTFTRISGGVNVSYPGYSQDIMYADIPNFFKGGIGVLASGATINSYDFDTIS